MFSSSFISSWSYFTLRSTIIAAPLTTTVAVKLSFSSYFSLSKLRVNSGNITTVSITVTTLVNSDILPAMSKAFMLKVYSPSLVGVNSYLPSIRSIRFPFSVTSIRSIPPSSSAITIKSILSPNSTVSIRATVITGPSVSGSASCTSISAFSVSTSPVIVTVLTTNS